MKNVFYLKIVTNNFFTIQCVQFWLDVAHEHNAHIYIMCEDEHLISLLKENCYFGELNLEEYSSKRVVESDPLFFGAFFDELTEFASGIVVNRWIKACVSHLSTFYHAKQKGITNFWNIDADDTFFYLSKKQVSRALDIIEDISEQENIDCISYDMWNSQSYGTHWSFGICYTNNSKDYLKIIADNKNNISKDFDNYYVNRDLYGNIDWIFTFLSKRNIIKAKSFYIENSFFVHFGFALLYSNFFPKPGSVITFWNNGFMYHMLDAEYEEFLPKQIDSQNNIKIEIGLPENKKMSEYIAANNTKKTETKIISFKMKSLHFIKHFILFSIFYVIAKFVKSQKFIGRRDKERNIILEI